MVRSPIKKRKASLAVARAGRGTWWEVSVECCQVGGIKHDGGRRDVLIEVGPSLSARNWYDVVALVQQPS